MKSFILSVVFFVFGLNSYAQSIMDTSTKLNYKTYYKKQEIADSLIFIASNYKDGFFIYKSLFNEFDFVWMEDCLRVFQVALIVKDAEMAMFSIKKAIENGLEIDKISLLNLGCQCNYYKDYHKSIHIMDTFILLHQNELKQYYAKVRPIYLQKMDKEVLKQIVFNHVEDELFKCDKNVMKHFNINFQQKWKEVLNKNYNLIDSFFKNNYFIGSKNLGYYSEKLMEELELDSFSIQNQKKNYYNQYDMKEDEIGRGYPLIPTFSESEYFLGSPLYITFYHDIDHFQKLLKNYLNPLIELGFLHPREYVFLAVKANKLHINPCIQPSEFEKFNEAKMTNLIRQKYYLPKIEIDIAKHKFAHNHKIQLYFGFLCTTR
jgi:hypothetical protein